MPPDRRFAESKIDERKVNVLDDLSCALLVLELGKNYDPESDKVFMLGRAGVNEMHDPLVVNGSLQPGLMVPLNLLLAIHHHAE